MPSNSTTDGDSGQVMSTNGEGQVSFTTLTGVTAQLQMHICRFNLYEL